MSNWISAMGIVIAAVVAIGITWWQMESSECNSRKEWTQKRLDILREVHKDALSVGIMRLPPTLEGKSDKEIREIGNEYFMQFNEGVLRTREIFLANRLYFSKSVASKIDGLWEATQQAEKVYEASHGNVDAGSKLYNSRLEFLRTFYSVLDAEISDSLKQLETSSCRPDLLKSWSSALKTPA